ncbi:MAG: hypothetical protein KIT56_07045 [Gammaproteobacteria bacterium]|nr:hypothetical protein [Gammaproteobacteria bacterium]MCW5583621.1 hypothetical protein [Gammaproteobacteria bacterium]
MQRTEEERKKQINYKEQIGEILEKLSIDDIKAIKKIKQDYLIYIEGKLRTEKNSDRIKEYTDFINEINGELNSLDIALKELENIQEKFNTLGANPEQAETLLKKAKEIEKLIMQAKSTDTLQEIYGTVYEQATEDLLVGPRMKSDATKDLELIVNAFLSPKNKIVCRYNSEGEIEVTINDKFPPKNLTQILKNKPDLEHIELNNVNAARKNYVNFLIKEAAVKPKIASPLKYEDKKKAGLDHQNKKFPTKLDYAALEEKKKSSDSNINNMSPGDFEKSLHGFNPEKEKNPDELAYAEKLAITLQTGEAYAGVNLLLRSFGQENDFENKSNFNRVTDPSVKSFLQGNDLTKKVKEMLLIAVFSHLGFSHIQSKMDTKNYQATTRGESGDYMQDINQQRKSAMEDKTGIVQNLAPTSTSSDLEKESRFLVNPGPTAATVTQVVSGAGIDISTYSSQPKESEKIFPASQFRFIGRREEENQTRFIAVPVRSLDDINPLSYSSTIADLRTGLIHLKDELQTILHDTPTDPLDEKLQTVLSTLIASINDIIKQINSEKEEFSSTALHQCHLFIKQLIENLKHPSTKMAKETRACLQSKQAAIQQWATQADKLMEEIRTIKTASQETVTSTATTAAAPTWSKVTPSQRSAPRSTTTLLNRAFTISPHSNPTTTTRKRADGMSNLSRQRNSISSSASANNPTAANTAAEPDTVAPTRKRGYGRTLLVDPLQNKNTPAPASTNDAEKKVSDESETNLNFRPR